MGRRVAPKEGPANPRAPERDWRFQFDEAELARWWEYDIRWACPLRPCPDGAEPPNENAGLSGILKELIPPLLGPRPSSRIMPEIDPEGMAEDIEAR